jgi:rfaE bifunctional protein nucleotidyltransferase chain/domain
MMNLDFSDPKIKTLEEVVSIVGELKSEGKTIVLCHGVFDLIHPGHIRHFQAARREGDVLIVTLTPDKYVGKGPGRPVFNQALRAESLASLSCVDCVAINEWPTAVDTIKMLKPDVYVKGGDYSDPEKDITGKIAEEENAVKSIGGKLHFTDEITFSSTNLLNTYFDVFPGETQEFLKKLRGDYEVGTIIEKMEGMKNLKVLVVGDTIIDEYWYCQPMGKSPKETIISTQHVSQEVFAGGILAVANHVAGFCDNVHLVTCLGKEDSREEFVLDHLKDNVRPKIYYQEGAPTVIKRRYVEPSFLTKMFGIYFFNDRGLRGEIQKEICDYLESVMDDYDLVLVSDFGHGLIGPPMIKTLCEGSRLLAVNTQTNSSNLGFNLITKYDKADYVCIDEPEIRLATHNKFGPLKASINTVAEKLGCRLITTTRGHRGSVTYDKQNGFYETPVFSTKIVDRVGAGDAYLSISSLCVAAGFPAQLVGLIGNAVGALAVQVVCNRESIEPVPLFKFLTTLLK